MFFRGKNISDYAASDIQSFIDNKVPESKTLDYKREINFGEKDKTELIYDISSFYNTDGGCVIIGLDEEKDDQNKNTGLPKLPDNKIVVANYDKLQLRIEEIVRQSTNPQITNLSFSQLLTIDGSNIFLIGIPKTRTLPAMVTYGNHNRVFKRKSSGKYSLDTYELYETFTQINILEERIAEFIKERQIIVSEDRFWPDIGSLSSVLIHVIPLSFFSSQIENFSSRELSDFLKKVLSPPGQDDYSDRYCLEGFHLFQIRRIGNIMSEIVPYNLIFRNGSTETFTNEPFSVPKPNELYLDGISLLEIIKKQLEKNFKLCQKLSIEPYFYLSIKLNNITNMYLTPRDMGLGKFKNNELQFPITLLSLNIPEIKKQLKNLMDILWQSMGTNECPPIEFNKVFDTFSIN